MSKCWYCNNELTSGDNPKHFGICNKCYDEMFKIGDTIIRSLMDKISELQKQLGEKENEIDKLTQDKISLALEQLEKVKENIKKLPITDYDFSGNFEKMYKQDAIRQIDNQIKQLKERYKND